MTAVVLLLTLLNIAQGLIAANRLMNGWVRTLTLVFLWIMFALFLLAFVSVIMAKGQP